MRFEDFVWTREPKNYAIDGDALASTIYEGECDTPDIEKDVEMLLREYT